MRPNSAVVAGVANNFPSPRSASLPAAVAAWLHLILPVLAAWLPNLILYGVALGLIIDASR